MSMKTLNAMLYGAAFAAIVISAPAIAQAVQLSTNDEPCFATTLQDCLPPQPSPVVPEPASMALFGLGSLAVGVASRKRSHKS